MTGTFAKGGGTPLPRNGLDGQFVAASVIAWSPSREAGEPSRQIFNREVPKTCAQP